ncbi:MAG TPA: acetolactate decarboxylase [Candidatus Acidoferrales bacterium]|nr:acetolactate decarboxylase [Candidatus Acidoferrales bacterium]
MSGHQRLTLRVHLPAALARRLGQRRRQTGQLLSEIVVEALERLLGAEDQTVFQTSTVNALMEGASTGDMTMGELKTHGDFGLGTFDGLDGEMIELDGTVYQVRADGQAHPVEDSARTPFATVSFFKADETARLEQRGDQAAMLAAVAKMLPSENMFHAVRIEGRFAYVKTRAVAKQEKSVGLEAAARTEPIFEFHDVAGTVVGFFTPDYLRAVNVPGYHLHFITADRAAGGHMLDCVTDGVTIKIHHTPEFELGTPGTEEFLKADLSRDHTAAIAKVER